MKKLISLLALIVATTDILAVTTFTQNDLTYEIITDSEVRITGVIDMPSPTSVTIPSTVTYNDKNYRVTMIANDVFKGCAGLSSVTFEKESNLRTIGSEAFRSCESLSEIIIPKSVTLIGDEAFYDCKKMSSVTFETVSKLQTIESGAFHGCESLSKINIPKSVTSIGYNAFGGCKNLSSVTFEGNACQNAIGGFAFYEVGTLESPATLTLPDEWENEKLPVDNKTAWYGGYFNSNRYQIPLDQAKSDAMKDIDAAMGEYKNNQLLLSYISNELSAINNATNKATVDSNKEAAIAKINLAKVAFQEVKATAFGTMGTKQGGPAIEVIDQDDNALKLYNPKKVNFIKVDE